MATKPKKLSIIIPCFNELLSLETLLNKCRKILIDEVEIILVDNGSVDGSYEYLLNCNLPKNIIPIRIEKNLGYGNGILSGLNHSKGDIVCWTHADLQTDLSDVIKGYNLYKNDLINKICLVKGKRKNRNIVDTFFTFSMGIYSSIILKTWLFDINAQPKIFHRSYLDKFNNPPLDFSLDLFVLYFFKSNRLKVKSFPVFFNNRKFGEAKGGGSFKGKLKLIKRTFLYIHKLRSEIQ